MSGVIAKQNIYLRAFRKGRANSPETAKSLKKLGIEPSGVFERMEKADVFVKTEEEKYYMNEQKAEKFVRKRAMYAQLALGTLVFGVILIYMISGKL